MWFPQNRQTDQWRRVTGNTPIKRNYEMTHGGVTDQWKIDELNKSHVPLLVPQRK
jgi:hypothetical protein